MRWRMLIWMMGWSVVQHKEEKRSRMRNGGRMNRFGELVLVQHIDCGHQMNLYVIFPPIHNVFFGGSLFL